MIEIGSGHPKSARGALISLQLFDPDDPAQPYGHAIAIGGGLSGVLVSIETPVGGVRVRFRDPRNPFDRALASEALEYLQVRLELWQMPHEILQGAWNAHYNAGSAVVIPGVGEVKWWLDVPWKGVPHGP